MQLLKTTDGITDIRDGTKTSDGLEQVRTYSTGVKHRASEVNSEMSVKM